MLSCWESWGFENYEFEPFGVQQNLCLAEVQKIVSLSIGWFCHTHWHCVEQEVQKRVTTDFKGTGWPTALITQDWQSCVEPLHPQHLSMCTACSVCGTDSESPQSSSTAAYSVFKGIWFGESFSGFVPCQHTTTSLLREDSIKFTLGDPRVWQTELPGWRWELGTSTGTLLRIEPCLLPKLPEPVLFKGEAAFQSAFHSTLLGPVWEPQQNPQCHQESQGRGTHVLTNHTLKGIDLGTWSRTLKKCAALRGGWH